MGSLIYGAIYPVPALGIGRLGGSLEPRTGEEEVEEGEGPHISDILKKVDTFWL